MDVCWSCGTSASGEEDPRFVSAGNAAPIPLEPILDPDVHPELEPELDDELPGPPPEFVLAYETDESGAQFLTDQLCGQGIRALKTRDLRPTFGPAVVHVGQILVHPDDFPQAREWLVKFERHRHNRQRRRVRHESSDKMWGALGIFGFLALAPSVLLGIGCYAAIGYMTPEEPVALFVGMSSGLALWVFLLTWLYRARKRAELAQMWGALGTFGLLALAPSVLLGGGCYAAIGYMTPEEPVALFVGMSSGLALWVFLLTWLYRARKRAELAQEQTTKA
jgi:hypothetical protein